MGYRNPKEQGWKNPIDRRQGGANTSPFGGMNTEVDASAIGGGEFGLLENCWIGDEPLLIRNRGGQSKVTSSALPGCVEGIFDAGEAGAVNETQGRIYFLQDGTAPTTKRLITYDDLRSPVVVTTDYGTADYYICGFAAGSFLYLGSGGATTFARLERLGVSDAGAPTLVATFPDANYEANHVVEHNGKVYVGSRAVGASDVASKVYEWDGVSASLTAVDTVADAGGLIQHSAGQVALGVYMGELYAFHANSNTLRKRNSAGVWSGVAMPGGISEFACDCMVVLNGVLYLSGTEGASTATIISYNGVATAVARQPAGSAYIPSMAIFEGRLYFGHGSGAADTQDIGKYDPDTNTWTDVEKDLSAQFPAANLTGEGLLVVYKRELMLQAVQSGGNSFLYKSDTPEPSGTWSLVATIVTGGATAISTQVPPVF